MKEKDFLAHEAHVRRAKRREKHSEGSTSDGNKKKHEYHKDDSYMRDNERSDDYANVFEKFSNKILDSVSNASKLPLHIPFWTPYDIINQQYLELGLFLFKYFFIQTLKVSAAPQSKNCCFFLKVFDQIFVTTTEAISCRFGFH